MNATPCSCQHSMPGLQAAALNANVRAGKALSAGCCSAENLRIQASRPGVCAPQALCLLIQQRKTCTMNNGVSGLKSTIRVHMQSHLKCIEPASKPIFCTAGRFLCHPHPFSFLCIHMRSLMVLIGSFLSLQNNKGQTSKALI